MTSPAATLLLLSALLWATLVGWSLARFFCSQLSRAETLAWSFATGLLVHASLYSLFLAARANPGPRTLAGVEAAVLFASFAAKRPSRTHGLEGMSVATRLFLALACCALGVSAIDFLAVPAEAADYLAIWGLKGKTIFLSSAIPSRLFHDPFTIWSHPKYPLFLPLCFASFAAVLRQFDGRVLFLLYPAFEAATLLLLFGYVARSVSQVAGSAAALVAAFCFPLYRGANAGMAEVPISFAFVLIATAWLDLLEAETVGVRLRLIVGSVLCVTLKQEGTLFVALLALWLLLRSLLRRRRLPLVAWLCLALPPLIQAAALRLLRGRVLRRDYDFSLLAPERWSQWLEHWRGVLAHLARVQLVAAAIPLTALVVFFFFSSRRRQDAVLPILLFQTAAYATAASLSLFGPAWGVESAFVRTTLALVPTLALVIGARAGEVVDGASQSTQRDTRHFAAKSSRATS